MSTRNIELMQQRGLELFGAGYNCAQATFAALAERFGLDEGQALRIAAAFGGGIARSGDICGALSGALMALGLNRGSVETSPEIKDAMYQRAKALIAAFSESCGATNCRDLLGFDLSTPEGAALAATRNTHKTICENLVKTAIALAAEA